MKYPGEEFKATQTIEYFPNVATMYNVALSRKRRESEFTGHWNGGIKSEEQRAALVESGWAQGAAKIAPLFNAAKLATIQTKGVKVRCDVAGFAPSVPRYVAGNPMNMRRRVKATTSKAPITIVVSVACSASVDADDMIKRGTAIACLVMYLSVFRAVDLYITSPMAPKIADDKNRYYFPMVKVGTSPFDLKALAWAVCHPGMARSVLYTMLNEPKSGIPWPVINGTSIYDVKGKKLDDLIKPILNLKDEDIYFPTVSGIDKDMDNPEQWARKYLKDHLKIEV